MPDLLPETSAQHKGVNLYGPMRFASVTQSEGTRTTYEPPPVLPIDHIQIELVPAGLLSSFAHEDVKDKADSVVSEAV
jgi:hypothetical protein